MVRVAYATGAKFAVVIAIRANLRIGIGSLRHATFSTQCTHLAHPTLQHHNSYNRTDNHRQWNAVRSPDDGHKDARNMLITNKSLFVESSWSHLYLLIKDARSLEHKDVLLFETYLDAISV